ncbi:extracellular solute-binding protein [Hahella ganghwensis]|uniref:extracellular solute-binding protein n=1 Tax=Hahella ganghwensis TaxID=286420 RepID=UPI001B7F8B59|nr:extracellular solute-binding protein [Hahella ganghwensis]
MKYSSDFQHFQYVNPEAPKGGAIRLLGFGTFDTLNPYTLKGTSPYNTPGFYLYGINELNETLLAGSGSRSPSGDEIQTAYGLIAESVSYPEDLSWAVFQLREKARFHDGHPIEASDVLYSYNTLLAKGHPRFKQVLAGVKTVEAQGTKRVKVTFRQANSAKDLLRFGELPIIPEHYWQNRDFEKTTLESPLLSGPYKIASVDPGQSITYERVNDYWGKDLPVNRGRYNIDTVKVEFYRDQTVAFEAFKAGNLDIFLEYSSKNWATGYDFPAVDKGEVIKADIPHQIPAGVQGLFMNSRRAPLNDPVFRQAISLLFDFEWTNKALFYDAYKRTESYFPNSGYRATGVPEGQELDLLQRFRQQLPESLFTKAPPTFKTDGSGNIRPQLRQAFSLFKQAGYELTNGRLINRTSKQPVTLEIIYLQKNLERVLLPYIQNLKKAGLDVSLRLLDSAQFKQRLETYDFDITTYVLPQGQVPAQELKEYFHSESVAMQGGRNYAGISHPAVDALVESAIQATSQNELSVTLRALDRVLLWQHYIVPNWHLGSFRAAYWKPLQRPKHQPDYSLGFENWWLEK